MPKNQKIAVIDVGSNSVKLLVCGRNDTGIYTLLDESEITRLGEGLYANGFLSEAAMARTAIAIGKFVKHANEFGASNIVCIGTMALRTASNSSEFIKLVQKNSSIELRVISGEEEARLSYLAAIANLPRSDGQIAVFDTGGGSTEFIFGRNNTIERRFSIDIAAVRLTETYFRHDPPAQFEINAVLSEIRQCFLKNGLSGTPDIVVGVGGAVTNIAGVMLSLPVYDSRRVNGAVITVDEIDRQISLYSSKKLVHRRKITGLAPQRADIILAGACILKVVAEFLNAEKITAVSSGLRHGVVYDLLSEEKAVL